MIRFVSACCLSLLAAFPAMAGERPRLVAGGVDLSQPDTLAGRGNEVRTEVLSLGRFSLGAVSEAPAAGAVTERMALGGFAAYSFDDVKLATSLKGDAGGMGADLSAAYDGSVMGIDGTTAVKLGYEWARPSTFSLNPSQPGYEAYRPAGDLSLSLSWTHDVTPSLSFSGFAAATRTRDDDSVGYEPGFRLGAGLGYRF